jgi:hypothetical protein
MGFLEDTMKSSSGCVVISVVLGLGLATMFQRVCGDGGCVVLQGPSRDEAEKYIWKSDSRCYKYSAVPAPCKK